MFRCTVKNRYSALSFLEEDLDSRWKALKHTWKESCDEILGKRKRNQKETWNLITKRKCFTVEINRCNEQARENSLTSRYCQLHKDVKKSAKKEFFNALSTEAESAAGHRNMKRLYDITRIISGRRGSPTKQVKNKEGVTITTKPDQRAGWVEHFQDIQETISHRNSK